MFVIGKRGPGSYSSYRRCRDEEFPDYLPSISFVRDIESGYRLKPRASVTCSGRPEPLLPHRSTMLIVHRSSFDDSS